METVLELFDIPMPERIPGHIFCPFHEEDTASCAVWDDHFHCFGCGVGGDALGFVARLAGGSFSKARAFLEGADIDLDATVERKAPEPPKDLGPAFEREILQPGMPATSVDEAHDFVEERWPHLGLTQLLTWGVRVAQYYLLIPHTDAEGVVRGVKTRTFVGGNKGAKRALPGSTYPRLYRVEDRPKAIAVILAEGESDTWTLTKEFPTCQVLGLPTGVQKWKPYMPALEWFEVIYVAIDNDDTSNPVADQIIGELNKAYRLFPPLGHKDWTDAVVARERAK